ncbi:MAG: FG-GAP repeat protein [Phycisphaerae bacterium]|nr:FG-GAP repeat protein [Phycisphaerae bacterium]
MARVLRSRKSLLAGLCLAGALPLMLILGCPSSVVSGLPSVSVSGPATNQTLTAGTPVTIIYSAQGAAGLDVRAFYDADGVAGSGDEVIFASGLATGTNRSTTWTTTGVTAGTYRVGVVAADGVNAPAIAYAAGTVTIQGQTSVTVAAPATDVYTNPGGEITIRFASAIAGAYTYTVFYDQDGQLDSDEITIVTGSASGSTVVDAIWNTASVPPGDYYVGVTVRETGATSRSATSYATGLVKVVAGSFIVVMQPANNMEVTAGTQVEVLFTAGVPGGGTGTIEVFYDSNQVFDGNESTIASGLSTTRTSALWDTTFVPGGTYYIGAALRVTQTGTAITNYAFGRVTIEGEGDGGGTGSPDSITVITPLTETTIFQGDTYTIRWSTGATSADGTVDLFRDTDADNNNRPDGNLQAIAGASGLNPALRQFAWDTGTISGRFFIVAQLRSTAGALIAEDASAARLTIRSPFFWVGEVGTSALDGAVLRGFNFQDHAGSGFTPLGDMDGDGVDDFLVLAQYGKPGLVNPGGIGVGEAFLIYGNDGGRLSGTFDLNRTGSRPEGACCTLGPFGPDDICLICGLPRCSAADDPLCGLEQGIIFTGVTIQPGSTLTTGITSACAAPDMDGDGLDELVFGIAKADSLSLFGTAGTLRYQGLLENDGQFLRGGIVVVSSENSPITDRSAVNRDGNRVIRLQEVGQAFDQRSNCDPTCNADATCIGEPCLGQAFKDISDPKDSKCNDFDYAAWRKGFYQPAEGVNPPLASPRSFCPLNQIADSGTPGGIPLMTGMVTDQPDLEPYGCRVLGQSLEDGSTPDARFGLTVSAIRANAGFNYILISAPNQTARVTDVPELSADRTNSGVVYQLPTTNYWDREDTLPVSVSRPHQYIVRTGGYYTGIVHNVGTALDMIHRPFSIVGPASSSRISVVKAIPDFNEDALMDILVGAPNYGTGGAAYIVFRRAIEAEGNYLLEKLALAPSNPERLHGVLIRGEPGDQIGEAFAGGGDFNNDGRADAIFGIPNHRSATGAALVVFGRNDLVSPLDGFEIDNMVANGDAALLVGANIGDRAGFNVASAGDVDGDGTDDLLISAPTASPMFDSNGDGTPDTIGLDFDGNGIADDLNNDGQPDDLTGAGIVYLVLGSNDLLGEINLSQIGTETLRGMAFVGRAANDNLGGGTNPAGLGMRSRGLETAGDVDADGRADILIGAPAADPGGKTNAGESYLIYGGFQP